MKNPDSHVSKETALEVFDLACRLYAQQHNQNYSLIELMQAGIEAHIPLEFIQQALEQVQARQIQARKQQQKFKVILGGVGVVIAAVTLWLSLNYNTEAKLRSVGEIGSGITLPGGINLFGVDLRSAELRGRDLTYKNLTKANLTKADLSGANLTGADLRGANLREAKLNKANLTGAVLVGADLTRADLRGANLTGVSLDLVELKGADLSGVIIHTNKP